MVRVLSLFTIILSDCGSPALFFIHLTLGCGYPSAWQASEISSPAWWTDSLTGTATCNTQRLILTLRGESWHLYGDRARVDSDGDLFSDDFPEVIVSCHHPAAGVRHPRSCDHDRVVLQLDNSLVVLNIVRVVLPEYAGVRVATKIFQSSSDWK